MKIRVLNKRKKKTTENSSLNLAYKDTMPIGVKGNQTTWHQMNKSAIIAMQVRNNILTLQSQSIFEIKLETAEIDL